MAQVYSQLKEFFLQQGRTEDSRARVELDYFRINGALGWNQSWFQDWSMYDGGCAAVTACDLCIYLAKQKGISVLYPYDVNNLTKEEYLAFSERMKPHLRPRWQGIDTLELYLSGLRSYFYDRRANFLKTEGLPGTMPCEDAIKVIREQIDDGMIVPFLLLYHKSYVFEDFQWHWFNLAGYEKLNEEFYVKAITYGSSQWLDFRELWDTGRQKKGGIIRIFDETSFMRKLKGGANG